MIDLLGGSTSTIPTHKRVTTTVYVAALAFHVVLFTVIYMATRHAPVRMSSGTASTVGIAAYVPGPTGTAGSSPSAAPRPAAPKKPAPTKVMRAQATPEPETSGGAGQTAGAADAQAGAGAAGSGPVRLGTGGNLTLLNKVKPAYPPIFERARIPGTVVLDAIIHRDGTIGDVKVLQSTNDQFAQAAIAAVKQWRYTPIPYEGIVTVTVNFTAGS